MGALSPDTVGVAGGGVASGAVSGRGGAAGGGGDGCDGGAGGEFTGRAETWITTVAKIIITINSPVSLRMIPLLLVV